MVFLFMVQSWFCHGHFMVKPWFNHRLTMDYQWFSHGFSVHGATMVLPWQGLPCCHGDMFCQILMAEPWFNHGLAMVHQS